MKRLLGILLILCIMCLTCGCSVREAISSDKQEYIVASLGFDGEKGKIKMLIEAIVVNTDDLKEDKQSVIFSGVGKNVNEAYSQIISQMTQPLSLGHNGITAIGSEVTASQLKDILSFCLNENQLNIATMLISADNAEELLSCKAVSSVAIGYDIMSMIEVSEESLGTVFKNRLYETEALRKKPACTFYMPYIGAEDEKAVLKGLAVFKNDTPARLLNSEEIPIFCLVTDSITSGEFTLEGKKIKTEYSSVAYDFDFNERLTVNINIRFKGSGDIDALKFHIQNMLNRENVFVFQNVISQKKPELWDKIKTDYDSFYNNAEKRVNIYE